VAVTQHLTLLCITAVLYVCAGVWLVSHPHRSVLPVALLTLCALSACACSGARLRTQSTVVLFWSRVAAQRQQQPQTHRCGCTVRWTTGHLCCVALVRLLFHRLAFAMVRCSAARTWSVAACVRICCCISQLQLHAHLCCNVISLAPIQLRN